MADDLILERRPLSGAEGSKFDLSSRQLVKALSPGNEIRNSPKAKQPETRPTQKKKNNRF